MDTLIYTQPLLLILKTDTLSASFWHPPIAAKDESEIKGWHHLGLKHRCQKKYLSILLLGWLLPPEV